MTHKLSELDEKTEDIKYQVRQIQADLPSKDQPNREIPLSNIFTRPVEGISSVYHSEKSEIKEKFPLHFPKESIEADYALVTQLAPEWALPIKESLPWNMSRPPAPYLYGKGKLPEVPQFSEESYLEWNIDNMSVGQIRQVLDRMYVSYRIMCMKGKGEIEACKCLIQCFTGTLAKWWEIESSPALVEKMEKEVLRDDARDIIFHEDGNP